MSPDLELTQIGEVTRIPYFERAYQHARILETHWDNVQIKTAICLWDSIVFGGVHHSPPRIGEACDTESEVIDVHLALDLCDNDMPAHKDGPDVTSSPSTVDDNVLPVKVGNTSSVSLETINVWSSVVNGMSFWCMI